MPVNPATTNSISSRRWAPAQSLRVVVDVGPDDVVVGRLAAEAEIVTAPATVAPSAGLVTLTVGGVTSGGGTVTVIVTFADDAPPGPMAVRI